jgi:hypothetical protein
VSGASGGLSSASAFEQNAMRPSAANPAQADDDTPGRKRRMREVEIGVMTGYLVRLKAGGGMIERRTEDKYRFNMQVLERAIGGDKWLVHLDNPAAPRERHEPDRAVHEVTSSRRWAAGRDRACHGSVPTDRASSREGNHSDAGHCDRDRCSRLDTGHIRGDGNIRPGRDISSARIRPPQRRVAPISAMIPKPVRQLRSASKLLSACLSPLI